MALAPTTVPPVDQQFTDKLTLINAEWLNFINAIANSPAIIPTQTAAVVPSTGTWKTGDYVRNNNVTILGPSNAQYIIDGWQNIAGGTPGQWVEVHLAVASASLATAPAPAPAPAVPAYDVTIQCENFTGATALTGANAVLAGYNGAGYADEATVAGVDLSATWNNVPAGTYNINIRYFNYGNQQNTVKIDGVARAGLMFPKSYPGWSVFTLGQVLLRGIGAPTIGNASTATTGGTLAAATYYYKVAATNAGGETLASAETSVTTTGATSSNTVPWTAVTGATGYKIYRGTAAGTENVFYTAGNVTSFLDTGAASTAGTLPTADTTTKNHTIDIVSEWGFTYWDEVEIVAVAAAVSTTTTTGGATNFIGPYNANLPAYGPAPAAAPGPTDPNGSTTINGLITTAGVNGIVSIPSGIYTLTAPIVPLNGQTIQPVFGAGVVLKAGAGYTGLGVDLSFKNNVLVRNLTFDGNYANRLTQEGLQTASMIQISNGSGCTIINNAFNNCPSYAIWTYNANGLSIRLNSGADNYQAIRCDGNNLPSTGIMEGNHFINSALFKSYNGFEILNTKSLSIKSNSIGGFGLTVPTTHGGDGTWGSGIFLTNSDSYLIENNTISPCYWSSVVCGSGATNGTVQYNFFDKGNNVNGVQAFWFEQAGADVLLLTFNTFNGGISIGDTGGDHATITSNIVNCDSTGLDVNSGCNVLTCLNNVFTSRALTPTQNGAFLWQKSTVSANVHMQGNTFSKFNHGVLINNAGAVGTVYNLIVVENVIQNGTDGVSIPNTITIDASCKLQGFSGLPTTGPFLSYNGRFDGAYPYGIKPTASNATLDGYVTAAYTLWKNNRLTKAPTFTATDGIYAGQDITDAYYVDTNNIWIQQPSYDVVGTIVPGTGLRAATVSEAVGYGMLILVIMASYDANAQTYFNGLFRLARGRPAFSEFARYYGGDTHPMNYLMDFRLGLDMSYQGGGWNATDGDMDIALALFMAHRQWGSAGTINYYQEALNTVAGLKAANFNQGATLTGLPYSTGKDLSRTSDWMLGHLRTFNKLTNDPFWLTGIASIKTVAQTVITASSPVKHLLPDWVVRPLLSTAAASNGGLIEGAYEGDFAQNAIRDPWRMGVDYLYTGDATTHTLVNDMVTAIKTTASGSATKLSWGYDLSAVSLSSSLYYEPTTAGTFLTGAMVDAAHQAWLDALVLQVGTQFNVSYFAAELSLLGLIVASNNWWRP